MYIYEEHRHKIFTDEGQREFLRVRDRAQALLKNAGAFKLFSAASDISGDTWTMMAYVDRLVEIGEIVEVTEGMCVAGQDRVFVEKQR